jgi:hypothetical protein
VSSYSDTYDTPKKLEARREYMKDYMRLRRKNTAPEILRETERRYWRKLKIRVLDHLGGPRCCNCGCDVIDILEINHINGGGHQELEVVYKGNLKQYYRDILNGKLNKENYNVLCKVCNALHYVEELKGIKGHIVIWNKPS